MDRIWVIPIVFLILVGGAIGAFACQKEYELKSQCITAGGTWVGYNSQCIQPNK